MTEVRRRGYIYYRILRRSREVLMRQRGATLALTVAVIFVLALIGMSTFFMINLFGGARELQHLTDSGTLSIGKQIITLGVPLNQTAQQVPYQYVDSWITGGAWGTPETTSVTLNNGVEGANFAELTDSNGNITLQNYDRVIAQTMLVGLNAQSEGTMPAAANAQTLFDAVQQSSNSLSQRLMATLSDPSIPSNIFLNVGMSNSLRMLGTGSTPTFLNNQYGVAYTSPGDCMNVWIDSSILPSGITLPTGALSSTPGPNSLPYLSGYTNIDCGPFTLQGTPVFPGQQPHLISLRDFQNNINVPIPTGYVAPNSFGTACSAQANVTSGAVIDQSASVVGILTTTYEASIPGGYLVISNWIGQTDTLPNLITGLDASQQATITGALTQRIREIVPTMTVAQVSTFLSTTTILADANKPTYIYLYPDPSSPVYANWHAQLLAAGVPDGTPGTLFASTVKPPTFPRSAINPQFGMLPDGNGNVFVTNHMYKWTPGCGLNSFLGAFTIP